MNINTKQYIEKYIKIRDKAGKIIDLKINQGQQKLYDAIKEQHNQGKPIRIIVLKARQIGFSTLTEGIIFKNTATKFNVNAGIITHKEEATTNLFNMSKRMYDNLPDNMKPSLKRSNAKELIFDNEQGTGLKSKIKCMTAGSSGVGRSDTFNYLHISELAFWGNNAKETAIGLFQAVPNLPNTMIVIESTANGFEYFKELWDMAVRGESDFIPVFVGWNELTDYQMPYTGFELTEEEKELQWIYNLSLEQLQWRRWCINNNCGGDIEQFKQEYPINPEEAFISSGSCIFDKEKIINRINKLKKPIKTGFFVYKLENKINMSNIEWVDSPTGCIKIYEEPKKGYPYVLGGDTAGEGDDNFTGHVIDNTNSNQVAVLKQKTSEDEYARQMYCLGMMYNKALLGLEINFSTYPTKKLAEYEYPNMYLRDIEDKITEDIQDKYGFRTTKTTRPLLVALLVEVFRDYIDKINDEDTLREALTFIRNDNGKAEAQNGFHDDLILGLGITHYIRTQQSYKVEIIEEEKKVELPFALTDDEEETDEVIGW